MKNVLAYLEESAEKFPDKTAVIDEIGECTFAQLKKISQRIGMVLTEYVSPQEPVAVMLKKGVFTLE